MPILLDTHTETRATNRFVAAVERFIDVMLWGPRQHEADLCWSLGTLPRHIARETSGEGSAAK